METTISKAFDDLYGPRPSTEAINPYIVYQTLRQLCTTVGEIVLADDFYLPAIYDYASHFPTAAVSVSLYIHYERTRRYLKGFEYYGPFVEYPITTQGLMNDIYSLSPFSNRCYGCHHDGCSTKTLNSYFCDDCIRYEWPYIPFQESRDHFLVYKGVHELELTNWLFRGQQGCRYRLHQISLPRGISMATPSSLGCLSYCDWISWILVSAVLASEAFLSSKLIVHNFGPVLPIAALPAQHVLDHYCLARQDVDVLLKDVNRWSHIIDRIEEEVSSAAVEQMEEATTAEKMLKLLPADYWRRHLGQILPYKPNSFAAKVAPPQEHNVPF